ncbi:MAG: SGNH/GDSL hydrolase family protein [Planctomycetaceae bacterium]
MASVPAIPARSRTSAPRRWVFRIAAVLLGLSVFGLAEAACIIGGWGKPTDYPDPYVGFSAVHPLFVRNADGRRFEIPKSRRQFFKPESFAADKPPGTYRIFCFGGSTVQGRPYSTPTAFPTWLELSLNAGDSSRQWETVNCGGISYASYRLAPIVKECLNYEPDLFVICTGHNEFLEDRTYANIKYAPKLLAFPSRQLSRLRIVTLARAAVSRLAENAAEPVSEDRPILKGEVDALLDYRNGIRAYRRDPQWRAGVVRHFEFNLRRMIAIASSQGVPVILVLPPSNLRRCPPFKSEHKAGLSAAERKRMQTLVVRARTLYHTDVAGAVSLLEQAVAIDDEYARSIYLLATWYDAIWQRTGNTEMRSKARDAYRKARELDICPLRMIAPLEAAMRRVAGQTGTPLIDAHALLEADVPAGILGDELLVDHIHPSPIKGHQKIARALAKKLQELGVFHPARDWATNRQSAFQKHRDSLPDLYFPRGQRTLWALREWAAGRADGPPIESR